MLRKTYDLVMGYASHPKAVWWMNFIAFIESSVFLIPPDPLFIAMVLKRRDQAIRLSLMCTVSSVLGGALGYYIGYGLYETLGEWIIKTYGLEESFANFQSQFAHYGFWLIALKGLTPIPYKLVTISSGVAGFNFYQFIIASFIARGFRFFMLGTLLWYFGPSVKDFLEKNLYLVTTLTLIALIGGFILFKYIF